MASAPTLAPSTKETTNYARLCRLLVDGGTTALRYTFDKFHSPANLFNVLKAGSAEHLTLQSLKKKKIINATQWSKLYPSPPSSVTSEDFDITLLMVLLRNICGRAAPATGWDSLPSASDTSVEANIVRVKYYRNSVYGHAIQASLDDPTFNTLWQDISAALVALGVDIAAIYKLQTESMDQEREDHYRELLRDWRKDEDSVKNKLDKMEGAIQDGLKGIKSELGSVSKKLETLQTYPAEHEVGLVNEHIEIIRQKYKRHEGWLTPFPWCEDFQFHLNDIFTRLLMVRRKKTAREITTRKVVEMTCIFNSHKECKEPKKVLIEGKPGMGKTTYCNKVAYDWATKKSKSGDCFPNFELVLLLKCGDVGIESDLWEAIDDQLLPREIQEEERNRFFEFICQNQSKILLVLDGLDELPESKLPEFTEIIQGRKLPRCRLVVTARHEAGLPVRIVCDTLLEIEGFTPNDAKKFILKYFKGKNDLSKKLLDKLETDEWLKEMLESPLNTSLLCLLCEDFDGILPESRTQLYFEIVQCVLMRYRKKKCLPVSKDDLIELYKGELTHLGSIALNGLREGNMYFGDEQLGNQHSDLPGFGVLSVQPGSSKRRPSQRYSFTHKSFQEFFAGYYLCCRFLNKEIVPEVLLADTRYFQELRQVLQFTCGLLAMRCEESAVALINGIANEVSKQDRNERLAVALNCIRECKKEDGNFHVELARTFGSCLKVTFADLHERIDDATAAALGSALQSNTTLTELKLFLNDLGLTSAESLATALKTNTTLTMLDVSYNDLGSAGAEALASVLKRNTTLKHLDLARNNLGPVGAESLAATLKGNTTLTFLNLARNNLCLAGVETLAAVLKGNTNLTKLDLSQNNLGPAGAESLATALKRNTSLTELDVSQNNFGSAGAKSLASTLQTNTTLIKLNLFNNNLGPAGAKSLAAALQTNTTLTELILYRNSFGRVGAKSLASALQTNTTLKVLDLSHNNLGPAGAESLSAALKANRTLTVLDLSNNELGPTCAESFAAALETNTTAVTKFDLSSNKIGPAGAESFAAVLKTNRTLTVLNLSGNGLGPTAAVLLAAALKTNTTLRRFDMSFNDLGPSSSLFADALNVNSTITSIVLWHNGFSESVYNKLRALFPRIWV